MVSKREKKKKKKVNQLTRKVTSKRLEITGDSIISGKHFGASVSPGHAGYVEKPKDLKRYISLLQQFFIFYFLFFFSLVN